METSVANRVFGGARGVVANDPDRRSRPSGTGRKRIREPASLPVRPAASRLTRLPPCPGRQVGGDRNPAPDANFQMGARGQRSSRVGAQPASASASQHGTFVARSEPSSRLRRSRPEAAWRRVRTLSEQLSIADLPRNSRRSRWQFLSKNNRQPTQAQQQNSSIDFTLTTPPHVIDGRGVQFRCVR